VDVLRWASFSGADSILPIYVEFLILVLFAAAMIAACSYTFGLKK